MVSEIAIKIALNSVLQLGSINTLICIMTVHHLKNMEIKMKKVILFLWFGDEKPPYISWTLENFGKMNPGWEIRYIEYSTEQLKNYDKLGDPHLERVMKNRISKGGVGFDYHVLDSYRHEYLYAHKDEFIIYCDLDCFPIAPFDDFIYSGFPNAN